MSVLPGSSKMFDLTFPCNIRRQRHATVTAQQISDVTHQQQQGRRAMLLGSASILLAGNVQQAHAVELGFKKDLTPKRKQKIPEDWYSDGPDGLKYYDVVIGNGPLAEEGQRVVVHYEAKWKGVTFMTSRQGQGVTGGNPLGFDVGARAGGKTLDGLDLAYGESGIGEIPPNATLDIDVELLSIKPNTRFGTQVKLVEG